MKIKISFNKKEADFLTKEMPNAEIDYYTVTEIEEDYIEAMHNRCRNIEANEYDGKPEPDEERGGTATFLGDKIVDEWDSQI